MARTQTLLATRIQKLYKLGYDLSYDKIGGTTHPYAITNWAQSRVHTCKRLTLSEAHLYLDAIELALNELTIAPLPNPRPAPPRPAPSIYGYNEFPST